jgi:MFS family permease
LLAAALGVGFITGPAIGGVIAGWWGLNAPFAAAAVLSAAGVVLSYFLLTESLPPAARTITRTNKTKRPRPIVLENCPATTQFRALAVHRLCGHTLFRGDFAHIFALRPPGIVCRRPIPGPGGPVCRFHVYAHGGGDGDRARGAAQTNQPALVGKTGAVGGERCCC